MELVLVGNAVGGTVSSFWIDGDRLVPGAVSEVGVGCSTFVARGEAVFVATKAPAIVACRLDRATGALTEVSRREVDAPLAYLALAPAGDVLLGASYHGGWAAAWPVDGDRVGEPLGEVRFRNPHSVIASPDGRSAYLAALGDDRVAVCDLPGMRVVQEVPAPEGSGPRHVVASADGASLYLLTEFTGEAIRFAREHATGLLAREESLTAYDETRGLAASRYGADPLAGHLVWGADVHVAGGWLLCSERTESTIAAISLGPDGRLGERGAVTGVETQPRGFTVAPDGRLAVVAGERSGDVGLYRVDQATGALTRLDRVVSGAGPNWVRLV